MATIIVEDGSLVANANSYISIANADVYFGTRLYSDVWFSASVPQRETALLQSARFLDNYILWFGLKSDPDQTMQWPRVGLYETQNIDGVVTNVELVNVVPDQVWLAQCELAIHLLTEDRTVPAATAGFSELSISGAVSFKADSSTVPQMIPAIVTHLIGRYGSKKSGNVKLVRG